MSRPTPLRRRDDLFIASVFALGAVCFTLSFFARTGSDMLGLAVIVALSCITQRMSITLYWNGSVSIAFIGTVMAGLLFGPMGAALTTTAADIAGAVGKRRSASKWLFNFGHLNVGALMASLPWFVLGWSRGPSDPAKLLFAGAASGLAIFLVSSVAVSGIITITSARSFRTSYSENFRWLMPHYVVLGVVAGALAILYDGLGVAAVLVLALPLLLTRYAMAQFVDRTRDNVLRLERSNDQLQHAYVEIRDMSQQVHEAYTGTLESLVTALDVRDQETRGHSVRVATHSVDIAKLLGIQDEEDLAFIYRGALMHDVGKIGVPDAILLKPAKLTEEEWEFMRKHSAMGYKILAQVPYLRPAAKIVLAHHERWDGGGYPRRLKGEEIPLGARIFALADTYDAIISDRPYRKGQSPEAAFQEILRCAGTQFDPKVIEAFEAVFPEWQKERPGETRMLYFSNGYRRGTQRRAS